jgi:hypothetical protein
MSFRRALGWARAVERLLAAAATARRWKTLSMAGSKARLPPRWFIVAFWHVHRWWVRATGGRKGLWRPRPGKWGALRLTTKGRRSGEPRSVIVGYYEDGSNLITMAMTVGVRPSRLGG